jgi:hypothetical protein
MQIFYLCLSKRVTKNLSFFAIFRQLALIGFRRRPIFNRFFTFVFYSRFFHEVFCVGKVKKRNVVDEDFSALISRQHLAPIFLFILNIIF